jgi:hypothetical protein
MMSVRPSNPSGNDSVSLHHLSHALDAVERLVFSTPLPAPSSGRAKRTKGEPSVTELRIAVRCSIKRLIAMRRVLDRVSDEGILVDSVEATFAHLLETGELLESVHFQTRLHWTRQALSKAVIAKRMFYLEVAGIRAYPAFFLDAKYNRKDLERVSRALGDLSGGSKYLFFTTPKGSLSIPAEPGSGKNGTPQTPLEALEAGKLELVLRAAQGYAER